MNEGFVLVHMHTQSENDNLEASAVLAGVVSHDRIWTKNKLCSVVLDSL